MRLRLFKLMVLLLVIVSLLFANAHGVSDTMLKEKFTYGSGENVGVEYLDWYKYPYYSSILEEYEKKGYKPAAAEPIVVEPKDFKLDGNKQPGLYYGVGGKDTGVFVWDKDINSCEWSFNVPVAGLYEVEIEYFMPPGSGNPGIRSLVVDGEIPFIEAGNIVFHRMWKDAGEPIINSIGDEVRPGQVEVQGWRTTRLIDGSGFYPTPFKFYFTPGIHTIKLEYIDQTIVFSDVKLVPAGEIPSYGTVKEQYIKNGYKMASQSIEFEAESNVVEKNDPTVRRESSGDPLSQPYSPAYRKLNVMGGYRWRRGNQSITWKFTVPEDGLYKIGMRVLQSYNDGLPSHRQIAIDGKVPFKEFLEYKFDYGTSWNSEVLKDEKGEPYLFYLEKGEHTLTMTVKMGSLTPIIQSLNADTLLISEVLTDIYKITGSNPDPTMIMNFLRPFQILKAT
ncbi:MAG: hypothetical protein GX754_05935 [Clostridiaceae bacterium]|nr:hypothetical protein [Clostridiaceae bacterium]